MTVRSEGKNKNFKETNIASTLFCLNYPNYILQYTILSCTSLEKHLYPTNTNSKFYCFTYY